MKLCLINSYNKIAAAQVHQAEYSCAENLTCAILIIRIYHTQIVYYQRHSIILVYYPSELKEPCGMPKILALFRPRTFKFFSQGRQHEPRKTSEVYKIGKSKIRKYHTTKVYWEIILLLIILLNKFWRREITLLFLESERFVCIKSCCI